MGVEFLRFDMSEYMERHTVSRLIGAPPGYVGFDQGGLLTDAVNKTPHCVLLLDEIEKAHPDLFNILLQVMDHATLTDNNGRKADFRNVILVMTTNAGAQELARAMIGFGSEITTGSPSMIDRMFSPEFRNRLSAIIEFAPFRLPLSNGWSISSCSNSPSASRPTRSRWRSPGGEEMARRKGLRHALRSAPARPVNRERNRSRARRRRSLRTPHEGRQGGGRSRRGQAVVRVRDGGSYRTAAGRRHRGLIHISSAAVSIEKPDRCAPTDCSCRV